VKFSFEHGGETFEFECFDNFLSRWVCNDSLQGLNYPALDFVTDVRVILDVGAYVGDSALYFSLQYPEAEIFAFEPAAEPYRLLEKNTRSRSNVHRFNYGLFSSDKTVPLYKGTVDAVASSVNKREETTEQSETVRLRSVREWLSEHGVRAADILKIDTEGCEVAILQGMGDLLSSVKVAYLEFHSEDDRKEIDRLLGDTHDLVLGKIVHQIGNVIYVAKDLLPAGYSPQLRAEMMETLTRWLGKPESEGASPAPHHAEAGSGP
jgi:FkbM family methyltransferase